MTDCVPIRHHQPDFAYKAPILSLSAEFYRCRRCGWWVNATFWAAEPCPGPSTPEETR